MPLPMLAAAMETISAGLAIAAAAVIVGTMLMRWYRMRQEFALLRLAMEKGQATLPPVLPQWLLSLRQGAMITALGIGLIATGLIGGRWASQVPAPPPSSNADAPEPPAAQLSPGPRPRPPGPRPHDAAFEMWERAQTQQSVCMAMAAGGVILLLLGIIRMAFAVPERRFERLIVTTSEPKPS